MSRLEECKTRTSYVRSKNTLHQRAVDDRVCPLIDSLLVVTALASTPALALAMSFISATLIVVTTVSMLFIIGSMATSMSSRAGSCSHHIWSTVKLLLLRRRKRKNIPLGKCGRRKSSYSPRQPCLFLAARGYPMPRGNACWH